MTKNRALAAGRQFRVLPIAASLIALMASLAAPGASAADLTLQNPDSNGRFSFNGTFTNWPGDLPAASGNNYFTGGLALRSNPGAGLTVTFAGSQLNLQSSILALRGGNGSTTNVGSSMIVTGTGAGVNNGTAGSSQTLASNAAIQLEPGSIFTLNPGVSTSTLTVSAALQGSGSVVVTSGASAGATIFSNANKGYTGNTTVTGTGLLQMATDLALPHASGDGDLIVAARTVANGGTVQLLTHATTIQGLADGTGGGGFVENGGATDAILTIQGNTSGDRTFSGIIQNGSGAGKLALTKAGSGTREILTGLNTYTGDTNISGGQLRISGSGTLGNNSAVTISGATGGGTLELDTVGTRGNALTLRGRTDTTFDVNNIAGSNTLNGVVTLADSTTAANTPDNYNFNVAAGDLTITNGVTATQTDGTDVNLNLSGAALTNGYMGAVDLTAATGSANDINKSGAGKWWLNGVTSGVTDINVSGGTLMLNNAGITLAGVVNLTTGGTLAQNIDNAFNGKNIQIAGGTLNLNGHDATLAGLHGTSGVVTSAADPGLTLTAGGTYGGTIDGAIDLTMNGGSGDVQILNGVGTNTYTGVTTISGGTLQIEKDSALGAATPTATANTVINGTGTLALSNVSAGPGITSAEAITLAGRSGTGTHINNVISDNTLTGPITLNNAVGGTNNFNIVSSADTLTIQGGISGSASGSARNLNLGGTGNGLVSGGAISMGGNGGGGAARINMDGSGTWTLNSSVTGVNEIKANAGTLVFGNSFAYSGAATVNSGGTLKQGGAGAFDNKNIALAGGTLNLNGFDATLAGLHGSGEVTSVNDPKLTLTSGGTYTGTITGPIDLTMAGANSTDVQVLGGTGINTYSGVTTISGGTLQVEKDSALGTPVGGQTLANGTVINGTGVLGLNGVTSGEYLTVAGRDAGNANPNAVVSTGNNTLSGPIALTATDATGTDFAFSSASGTLTVDGAITGDGSNALIFRGAGDTVVNGSITLTEAGSDHGVAGEGSGAKTIAGAVDLSGSRNAVIVNADAGSLTVSGAVKMNDVTGAAWVRADGGDLSVTGTLEMKNAAGVAAIANYGAGAVEVAGADMSGAKGGNSVWNDVGGSLTVGSVAVAGVLNMSEAEGTWSQVVNSGAGSVIVYSKIDMTNSTATNNVVGNRGTGSLIANGDIDMTGSTGTRQVGNAGTGSTTVDGTLTNVAEAGASVGTFIVGSAANLADVDRLGVSAGATIDATAVVSDFNIVSGQTLYGAGTVKEPTAGDVVAKAGSTIDIGNGLHTDIATLSILGDMTLEEDSLIQINLDPTGAGLVDLLQVSDILNIVDRAKLVFYWTVAPTALVYEFARYETLDPTSGTFAVTNAPDGYHIDYGHNGHYVALVSDIPVPAPLFLMGLGALIMGAGRRYAKW